MSKLSRTVSIIVPVYNREQKVKRLIASIQDQTFVDWELLLIDDSSTDETFSVIESASELDPRIVVGKNRNLKGPSGARNTGLDIATGKYIAYQDSDDEWVPYHLETMVYYLNKYSDQIDIMTANPLRKLEETGEVFNYDEMDFNDFLYIKIEEGYLLNKERIFDKQLRERVLTTQCIVGKASIIKSVRWNENLRAATDNLYNLELCSKPISICHLQDYHAIYWAHQDNITNVSGQHSPKRMESVQKSFVGFWEYLLKELALNSDQRKYVKNKLSICLAWHLGYNVYEAQGKYNLAFLCYLKAIVLQPARIVFYKSAIKSAVKSMLMLKIHKY